MNDARSRHEVVVMTADATCTQALHGSMQTWNSVDQRPCMLWRCCLPLSSPLEAIVYFEREPASGNQTSRKPVARRAAGGITVYKKSHLSRLSPGTCHRRLDEPACRLGKSEARLAGLQVAIDAIGDGSEGRIRKAITITGIRRRLVTQARG